MPNLREAERGREEMTSEGVGLRRWRAVAFIVSLAEKFWERWVGGMQVARFPVLLPL